jgi:hypothetical protein
LEISVPAFSPLFNSERPPGATLRVCPPPFGGFCFFDCLHWSIPSLYLSHQPASTYPWSHGATLPAGHQAIGNS